MKKNEAIKRIGDEVIDAIYKEVTNGEYSYEDGEATVKVKAFTIKVGNTEVEAEAYVKSQNRDSIEVLLYAKEDGNKDYGRLLNVEKAVNEYVKENLDLDDLRDMAEENMRDSDYDYWDEHGFADMSDYLHWRFG